LFNGETFLCLLDVLSYLFPVTLLRLSRCVETVYQGRQSWCALWNLSIEIYRFTEVFALKLAKRPLGRRRKRGPVGIQLLRHDLGFANSFNLRHIAVMLKVIQIAWRRPQTLEPLPRSGPSRLNHIDGLLSEIDTTATLGANRGFPTASR